MQTWKLIAMAVGIVLGSLIVLGSATLCCLRRRWKCLGQDASKSENGILAYDRAFSHSGITGLDVAVEGIEVAAKWRNSHQVKPFVWPENPVLLAEAMDRGWAAFAFVYNCCSQCPATSAGAFVLCTKCCLGDAFQPEVSWEIGPGAAFMQFLRLNPKLVASGTTTVTRQHHPEGLVQTLQSALPLPGPLSGSSSFPQEGYFEVTIVAVGKDRTGSDSIEGDDVKLILKPSRSEKYIVTSASTSNGLQHDNATKQKNSVRAKPHANGASGAESTELNQVLGVGFCAGISPPFRLPGADRGSIGLLSNGHIFLNGGMHYDNTGKASQTRGGWGAVANTTIGCGFSPLARRAFFTLDGELVAEVKCREFGYPLHAVVGSNFDVTLLVNYGQCSFEFMPANTQRVAHPTESLDDNSDLFSIRRLDSNWWSGRRTSSLSQPEVESDLFEIALNLH